MTGQRHSQPRGETRHWCSARAGRIAGSTKKISLFMTCIIPFLNEGVEQGISGRELLTQRRRDAETLFFQHARLKCLMDGTVKCVTA